MASPAPARWRIWTRSLSPGHLGLVGQTSTSWGAAGGLVAALVVCGHLAVGAMSSSVGFLTATIFFAAGAVIGFLHGSVLGYVGRPPDVTRRVALQRLTLGAAYALPALLVAWLVAMMLALSVITLVGGRYLTFAITIPAWGAALVFLVWAVVETGRTLGHLLRRWPDARALLLTVGLAVVALLPVFLVTRPEIWVVGVRPTGTAAAMMAIAAGLWIVGPFSALALLALRAWRRGHGGSPPGAEAGHGRV